MESDSTIYPLSMPSHEGWFKDPLINSFRLYTSIWTTSDSHAETCPSTPRQWDLATILKNELVALGIQDVVLTEHCYVLARIPASSHFEQAKTQPMTIGFCAHMDTSSDTSGKDVKLVIHENYQGGPIIQPNGPGIDPKDNPVLNQYIGRTILSSDGSTLLGADDKAGIAEIMTAIRYLLEHPELPHGPIEVIFTPDEEIGRGVDKLPLDWLQSKVCYTLDGDEEGSYNDACFNAWAVEVEFQGISMHPGYARGKLVNAISMATMFLSSLPRTESPEATDGHWGFYSAQEIVGTLEKATVRLIIRDFERSEVERRTSFIHSLAKTVELGFPGSRVVVKAREQYKNMKAILDTKPEVVEKLEEAIRLTGMEPWSKAIRGGTDGARLTEKGLLTPNIFAGGLNFHSVQEWVPLDSMTRATMTIINLAQLWTR